MKAAASKRHLSVEIIPDTEQGGFTARLPDIPAYGEGDTEEEAVADLKVALRGYIETFGMQDAMNRLNASVTIRTIAVDLTEFTRA